LNVFTLINLPTQDAQKLQAGRFTPTLQISLVMIGEETPSFNSCDREKKGSPIFFSLSNRRGRP